MHKIRTNNTAYCTQYINKALFIINTNTDLVLSTAKKLMENNITTNKILTMKQRAARIWQSLYLLKSSLAMSHLVYCILTAS